MTRIIASTTFSIAIAALAVACGASQKKGDQPKVIQLTDQPPVTYEQNPAATQAGAGAGAAPAPGKPHLEFAEMTVFQGQTAIVKVHADGTTEFQSAAGWKPGPTMQADGTVVVDGKPSVRVNVDGSVIKLPGGQATPVTITADKVSVKQGDKESGLTLAEDGTISVLGAAGKGPALRVEGATTPGQRESALTAMTVSVLIAQQKSDAGGKPGPQAQPAPGAQATPGAKPSPGAQATPGTPAPGK